MDSFEFSLGGAGQTAGRRQPDDPLRILVLANFRGAAAARPLLAERKPRKVDIDNFATLQARWQPAAQVSVGDATESISFPDLEDFSPDRLFDRMKMFAAMRQSRADIAAGRAPAPAPADSDANTDSSNETDESAQDTVGRLLGEAPTGAPKHTAAKGLLDNFIRNVVAADAPAAGADARSSLDACDAAIAETMRSVLHDPALQNVESTWRGLYELISALEDEPPVSVQAFDVTAAEISTDLLGDAATRTLTTRFVDEARGTFGGKPWDLLVTAHRLDADCIAALGAVASAAGGKLLVDADIETLDGAAPEAWQALRASPTAKDICVGLPRVLLRTPWGKQSEEAESFSFEECAHAPTNDELLWGSAALRIATCAAQRFQGNDGSGLSQQAAARDLPMFVFEDAGERRLQSVVERPLTDNEAEALRKKWGVLPVVGQRDGNRIMIASLASVAG